MREFKIADISPEIREKAQHKIDFKTKPLGSLGKLEQLAVQVSSIQGNLMPKLQHKRLFVFAADHGVAAEGVSAFPQEVSIQMVQNFLSNGAAINILSAHNHISLDIVDAGLKAHDIKDKNLIDIKCANGTENFAKTEAMQIVQAETIIENAYQLFKNKNKKQKIDIIALGEMGIANTTSATAIISTITGLNVEACTGRGTGVDDDAFLNKIRVINDALNLHQPDANNGLDILQKVGGFEIAAMVGMALAAAENNTLVVLDGFISTAAGLIAYKINPKVAQYFVSGHRSVEKGHILALDYMGLVPVLDLDFRLGEGTGAALTIGLIDAACKIMCNMASFEDAGVSNK